MTDTDPAYLLDARVVLWVLADSDRLGPATKSALFAAGAAVYVSSVTTWELRIMAARGKVAMPDDIEAALAHAGLRELPLRHSHTAAMAERVSALHPTLDDPFDRIVVAQARLERLELFTVDPAILGAGLLFVRDARK